MNIKNQKGKNYKEVENEKKILFYNYNFNNSISLCNQYKSNSK